MLRRLIAAVMLGPVALALPAPALADDVLLPPAVREMVEAAIANGNEAEIATVAKIARQTNPGSADEIGRLVDSWKKRTAKTRETIIREARFTQLWNGRIEAGGFRSTGSTSEIGITLNGSVKRTGIQWSHKLTASVDYRRANGLTSRERFFGSYEPRYEFDPRGFAYGLAQFERDPTIGYDERYTGSVGVGYKLIVSQPVDLSVDIGPAVRHVSYVDGPTETKLGARGSMDFTWRLSPRLTFKQTAAGYAENDVFTFNSLTALETKVGRRLSTQFSYLVQYESQTFLTPGNVDTLSRVTLTYDF